MMASFSLEGVPICLERNPLLKLALLKDLKLSKEMDSLSPRDNNNKFKPFRFLPGKGPGYKLINPE
jgi:hypothetical protein